MSEIATLRRRMADLQESLDRAPQYIPDGQSSITVRILPYDDHTGTQQIYLAQAVNISADEIEGGAVAEDLIPGAFAVYNLGNGAIPDNQDVIADLISGEYFTNWNDH